MQKKYVIIIWLLQKHIFENFLLHVGNEPVSNDGTSFDNDGINFSCPRSPFLKSEEIIHLAS